MPYNPYDLIIGSIYIGGKEAVEKYNSKFTLIVNCSNAVQCPPTPECILFSIANSVNDVTKYFNMIKGSNVLERLRDCVLKKKPVLVNCTEGMHRSCTMVACYLMKYEKMNVDQAMKFIKSKRSIAFNPVYNLKGVLDLFYNYIKPKKEIVAISQTEPLREANKSQARNNQQNKNNIRQKRNMQKTLKCHGEH
jgi:hypothetical protein